MNFFIDTNGSSNWSTHNWVHDNTFNTTGQARGNAGTGCTDGGGDVLDIGRPGGSPGQTTDLDNNNTIENNIFNHAPHASTDNYGEFTVFRNNVYHNEPWSAGCTHTSIWPPNFSNTPATYSTATTYSLGQTALSGAQIYVSVVNSNLNHPVTNTAFWQKAGTCTACVPNYTANNGLYAHRNAQITEDWGRLATYVLVEGNRYGYAGINDTNGVGDNLDLAAPQNIVRYNLMYASMSNNFIFKYSFGGAVGSGGNGGTYNRVYNNTMYMGGYGYPLGLTFIAGNSSSPQQQANLDTYAGSGSGIGNVLKNNLIFNGDGYSNWGTDFVSGSIGGSAPPYSVGNGWLDVLTASNNWCSGAQPAGTPAGACTNTGDPQFTNPDLSNPASTTLPDLSLQSTSVAIDGGTFLTTATNSGTNATTLTVADALYFQDGTWGSDLARLSAGLGGTFQADWIAIGTVTNVSQIASVTYGTNTAPAGTITLVTPLTWSNGASIWLYKKSDGVQVLFGAAPDYGAKEFSGGNPPVPIVCPNKGLLGNQATCQQPPLMAFGKQGASPATTSMAVSGSINNCSTLNIPGCLGTGPLTLATTVFTLSGTNFADFAVQAGGCTPGLVIPTGGNCQFTVTFTPSAPIGTNEVANLTIAFGGAIPSSVLALTGTSATVTTLGAITTPFALTPGVNYQLTQNISCATSCFTVAAPATSFTDLNLNGFTATWCTGTSTAQEGGIITRGNNWYLTAHNGSILEGAGSCTGTGGTGNWGSGDIIGTGNNGMVGTNAFNLTMSQHEFQGRIIADNYSGTVIPTVQGSVWHDIIYTDNDPGNCATIGCRSQDQFYSFTVVQGAQRTGVPVDAFYNNSGTGGPQGAFATNSTGALCSNNLINLGNSGTNGSVANGYVCQDWGAGMNVNQNLLFGTGTNGGIVSGRGIQLANVAGQPIQQTVTQYNSGIITILDNDAEYACATVEFGSTYGIQIKTFNSGTISNNTINNNNIVVQAGTCGAYGFSTTNGSSPNTASVGNVLRNNNWTCKSIAGFTWTASVSCAGMRIDYSTGLTSSTSLFSSMGDTVTGDSSDLYLYFDGSDPVTFSQDTFVKPSTAVSGWVWIDFDHGVSGQSSLYGSGPWTFVDPVFKGGATESNTNMATWATNNPTLAFSYVIQFTQTVFVKGATNGKLIQGATCQYTDSHGGTYSATSDSTGACTVIVNENKYAAASGAVTTTAYNNYTLAVSNTGCTTNTQTGLNITSPNTSTVTLAGCGGTILTGALPTLFGFDQTLLGAGHENSGLTYGWQRSWDTPCVWGLIEATAGTYNVDAQCHNFVQSAVNHNAGVQFTMGRTPASRITGTCQGGYVGTNTCAQLASDIDGQNLITPAFLTAFTNYMASTWPNVKYRIEGRNEADLANECAENSAIGGHCSMTHLVKEQQTIYNTIKAINPKIQVLCPPASTLNHFGVHLYNGLDTALPPFPGAGFVNADGLNYCDVMAIHPYFSLNGGSPDVGSGNSCSTTGSNFACVPEEAVNGSSGGCSGGALGQVACILATENKQGFPVESSETNWGSNPPNLLAANGGMTDTQKRQWIGRYFLYALNSGQKNITWYTWECPSGNLAVCFGTLAGSSVSGASLTALATIQDWFIGSTYTAPFCTVSSNAYTCTVTLNTASGKVGTGHIVFTNNGTTPTIAAFGAANAYRLDGTSTAIVSNQRTLDGEPTLLF